MIIFVGDAPSNKNNDPNIPFVGTQSYKRLLQWIFDMNIDITEVCMYNKRDSELTFWRMEYKQGYRPIRFVALGEEAAKQLDIDGIKNYFKLPHPSGLNRKLNDKKWLEEKLNECKEWIHEQKLRHN